MDKDLKNLIHKFAYEEKIKALKEYGVYNSDHEFYSVLLEEFEEVTDELILVYKNIKSSWVKIKKDILIDDEVRNIISSAENAITELIQVIAVCKKYVGGNYDY